VRLKKDHYAHKSYGKIYTPVFELVEWVSMDGETPKADEPAWPTAEQEAAKAPTRRRRAA
jgi:hypothetical protein